MDSEPGNPILPNPQPVNCVADRVVDKGYAPGYHPPTDGFQGAVVGPVARYNWDGTSHESGDGNPKNGEYAPGPATLAGVTRPSVPSDPSSPQVALADDELVGFSLHVNFGGHGIPIGQTWDPATGEPNKYTGLNGESPDNAAMDPADRHYTHTGWTLPLPGDRAVRPLRLGTLGNLRRACPRARPLRRSGRSTTSRPPSTFARWRSA